MGLARRLEHQAVVGGSSATVHTCGSLEGYPGAPFRRSSDPTN